MRFPQDAHTHILGRALRRNSCLSRRSVSQIALSGSSFPLTKPLLERIQLHGKTTVITGGAKGIGLAIAKAVAELGSDVALFDMMEPQENLGSLTERYGRRFQCYRTDVTSQESLEGSFAEAARAFGQLHNCVTAAGIVLDKPFLENTWEESRRILDVNVIGTFHCAQLAAKYMKEQGTGGSIVTIASIGAHCAIPGQYVAIYGASKGAVKLMSKTLAVELGPYAIRVNSLSPGFIETDMTMGVVKAQPNLWRTFNSTPPLGRIGQRDDLTMAAAYLLSDAASYTSRADIPVTGALHGGRIVV